MKELLRTNDIVLLGAAEALLRAAEIPCFVADTHMSILEGSIGAFQRRLLVANDDETRARQLLSDAGFGAELRNA
ncbi:DUF2007 domain-containing protein [Chelatococcus composti]|jgi:hypothetical protein|uniref:DUF2007 domain-containing protein n=1 Tax=Chelatococcus composti TaxID=1743235 RepID=A0A841K8S1_9HYPH|nr:DUF2007 domain-containing protein [Chelatococcus composti]MBB6168500.1 hypothetical protein [Chelatococcus composti]MBS7736421.1 DUF2007 domain-containing protein [Chelatococcus composti]PZN37123.1 MAG: hypothetical protein DIU59_17235 [Pseudomonadota bacterium]GGG40540.1 hypothetical protein GCM10008026_21860 [Chelatococcus composti]